MEKGQISIDLLLTLVVVILVVLAIGAITLTYSEASERSRIQQELQYTANKTASLITAAQALADSNFTLIARTGKLFYTDENKNFLSAFPDMRVIDGNTINTSITIKGIKQDANAYFFRDPNTTVIWANESTTGEVVIIRAK